MTTWNGRQIAAYARAGGIPDDDLVIAVAVALAGSGGDDHALVAIPAAGGAEWRGLWLLRSSLLPAGVAAGLYDPVVSARALSGILGANGGRWDWHEVYRSGAWRERLGEARAAVDGDGDQGAQLVPSPRVDGSVAVGALVRTLGQAARSTGATFRISRR